MNVGRSELKRYTAGLAVCGIVFLNWACGPSQKPPVSVACDASNVETRLTNVRSRLDERIKEDEELRNAKLSYEVRTIDGVYLEVIVAGEVVGQDGFERLTKILRTSIADACVKSIIYAAELPPKGGEAKGFKMMTGPCPSGSCGSECC